MDFDLSDFEVRSIPETPARLEQKFLSMELIEKQWLEILSNEDFKVGRNALDFDDINRVDNSELLKSFNEYTLGHKPNHWNWGARQFHPQFKKLVPFAKVIRVASLGRECEIPSINECRLFFVEKFSLDTEIFDIN